MKQCRVQFIQRKQDKAAKLQKQNKNGFFDNSRYLLEFYFAKIHCC